MIRTSCGRRLVVSGGFCAVFAAACSTVSAIVAFPGAEGFGANSTGGRGGDVYHVTTLVDDPNHLTPGSLFYGLYSKNVPAAGRTIVFDVGGTIHLGSNTLDIKNIRNVTIAGQTAPSPITIIGNTVQVTSSGGSMTSNIVMQYLSIRKGLENSGDSLSIKGAGTTSNIMADHISASWSEDEVISVAGATNHATNVTVQYCTMSEALTSGHQYGALVRNDESASVSYIHNLFSQNASRNPRPGTYLNTQLDFEFQNNVIYNWSDRAGYTGGASETDTENVNMNYVGNYLIAGPNTPASARTVAFTKDISNAPKDPLNLHFYQSGNKIDSTAGATRDGVDSGWGMFSQWNGTSSSAFPVADQLGTRLSYPDTTPDSADDAYGKVIASVGAFPYARSATDQRIVGDVVNYTGASPLSAPNSTEWNNILSAPQTTRPAGFDTDNDGMPNAYETARGYNPAVADNNVVTADGYTRLEHYLQYLTLIANWNNTGGGNWSDYLAWRGTRPEAMDSTANFGSTTTAPSLVNLHIPASVGQLNFDSPFSYTIGGTGTLTLDVISGNAVVTVTSGTHAITAPVVLADDTTINATTAGGGLIIAGPMTATGKTITKTGAGAVVFSNVRSTGLIVNQGLAQISAKAQANDPAGTSIVQNLAIASGAQLDLTNNSFVIDYTGSIGTQLTTTRQALQSGQLVSSVADTTHALGYADNATLGLATFGGQSVDASSILIKYTYAGDSNLDGQVDVTDLGALATNWQSTGVWTGGDFNYDGFIDVTDLGILATNWQAGVGSPLGQSFQDALASVGLGGVSVPEPFGMSVIGLLCLTTLRRARRII